MRKVPKWGGIHFPGINRVKAINTENKKNLPSLAINFSILCVSYYLEKVLSLMNSTNALEVAKSPKNLNSPVLSELRKSDFEMK